MTLLHHQRSPERLAPEAPMPSIDAAAVGQLLSQCPAAHQTPLTHSQPLADAAQVQSFWVKDERARMNLGSFKALGAAYVIAHEAASKSPNPGRETLRGRKYVTASAGNHGLSVAAGARIFGAEAIIYLSETVPESFAKRLEGQGAEVRRAGADYEASMDAALKAAETEELTLLSDSSWEGYDALPHRLMEGYLQLAFEVVLQMEAPPTHIFLQAGVGGLAGACAAYFRESWGDAVKMIVVEPEAAPALQASIEAGACVETQGAVSSMGRLDCKVPSLIALNGLARDADYFMTLSDDAVEMHLPTIAGAGLETSPSGGAGIAAALAPEYRDGLALNAQSRVLCILSEGPA